MENNKKWANNNTKQCKKGNFLLLPFFLRIVIIESNTLFGCPSNHHSNDDDDVFCVHSFVLARMGINVCTLDIDFQSFRCDYRESSKELNNPLLLYNNKDSSSSTFHSFSPPSHIHTQQQQQLAFLSRCVHVNNKKVMMCQMIFSFFYFSGASIDKVLFPSPSLFPAAFHDNNKKIWIYNQMFLATDNFRCVHQPPMSFICRCFSAFNFPFFSRTHNEDDWTIFLRKEKNDDRKKSKMDSP